MTDVNFAKWSRNNLPKLEHRFQIGDTVVLVITDTVEELVYDCDGTPLYKLAENGGAWSDYAVWGTDDLDGSKRKFDPCMLNLG